MTGSCPNPEERREMIAAGTISTGVCVCYPPEGYNGAMGEGGSDTYWDVEVTVTAIGGWFILVEDKCEPGNAIYVYYSVSKGEIDIKPGDRIRLVSKPTMFFGIDELDRPLHIERVARNVALCPPQEITAKPFGPSETVCTKEADKRNHHFVVIKNVKVSMLVNEQPYPEGVDWRYPDSARESNWYQCGVCMMLSPCLSSNGTDMGSCDFEIEDAQGNRMMIVDVVHGDRLQPFFEGIASGGQEVEEGLKTGDTFLEIEGYIMFHRGGYHEEAGGFYVLSPTKLSGFREPLPEQSGSGSGSEGGSSDTSSLTLILVGALVVVILGVLAGILWGAYNHRTVKKGVASATGGETHQHEELDPAQHEL
jgi:hypothetical protein